MWYLFHIMIRLSRFLVNHLKHPTLLIFFWLPWFVFFEQWFLFFLQSANSVTVTFFERQKVRVNCVCVLSDTRALTSINLASVSWHGWEVLVWGVWVGTAFQKNLKSSLETLTQLGTCFVRWKRARATTRRGCLRNIFFVRVYKFIMLENKARRKASGIVSFFHLQMMWAALLRSQKDHCLFIWIGLCLSLWPFSVIWISQTSRNPSTPLSFWFL